MRERSIDPRLAGRLRTARRALFWTFLGAALFLAGTYLAPLLDTAGIPGGGWARALYAPLCHQIPSRSFEIGGSPQAVCSRCAGLYWGGTVALLAAVWLVAGGRIRLRPAWLAWAVAPTAIDALLPWLGLPGLPSVGRHVLAWPAGFAAGLFLASGIVDIVQSAMSERSDGARRLRREPLVEESDG